jgi:hypothetical protein
MKRILSFAGVEKKESILIPKNFTLHQNFPNPFNPNTEIRYQTSEISHVSLKVYDLIGRETAKLVNEEMSAGEYSVKWDASAFPSGIYFAVLRSSNKTQIKKMLLLR